MPEKNKLIQKIISLQKELYNKHQMLLLLWFQSIKTFQKFRIIWINLIYLQI